MTTRTQQGIVHIPGGTGQTIAIGPGWTIVKLSSADTAEAMAMWEGHIPPGFRSPPPHAHPEAETFYLLEGDLEFTGVGPDGLYTVGAGPGSTVHIPAGTPHTFVNTGLRPVRVLTISMPGGLERYFAEFAALLPAGVPPDVALDARTGTGTRSLVLHRQRRWARTSAAYMSRPVMVPASRWDEALPLSSWAARTPMGR